MQDMPDIPANLYEHVMEIDRDGLLRLAAAARAHAYAPYSHFTVGAALLAESGQIYTGCNIESVSFTPTMCAERVAVGTAIAAGERPGGFLAIAIVADDHEPSTPCGVCRQVLAELAPGAKVIMSASPELDRTVIERTVEELLPDAFTFKHNEE